MRITPWFVATEENEIGVPNGYVHNFPNNVALKRFI